MSTPGPRPPRRGVFARVSERTAQFTYIGIWAAIFVVAGLVSAGATFVPFFKRAAPIPPPVEVPLPPSPTRDVDPVSRLQMPAKVVGDQVQPFVNGRYVPIFWAGVNLGSSVPGQEPGATAATRLDYDRWFAEMGELGVSVVRIYTILSPQFYDALREYNLRNPTRPIYVLHGIWIPEEDRFYKVRDIWDRKITEAQRSEIKDAVAAAYGDAVIEKVPGHASGLYRSDISPWLMGWSFGIEWDPEASHATDLKHKNMKPFRGAYFRAKPGASAMESWIAAMMDELADEQAKRGWSVPITFTNWDTTDPVPHPAEPLHTEDLVSIDATHIVVTAKWPAGYFASFHAYPYYPDFLRWEPSYQNYHRPDGKRDPYAGYIHHLRRHHKGMALMVTEFGQPTSLGCAHLAPLGRDQGCHHEKEAAAHVVDMMKALQQEGLAGGIVFMWLDEWFKFTWNTIDYELPGGHRALWRNVFTNEEHFGIIAAEPGPEDAVVLDGDDGEWAGAPSIGGADGSIRDVAALNDVENIYLRLKVTPEVWKHKRIVIGLNARPGGNKGLPGLPGIDADAEMAVVIEPGGRARMYHAAWIEPLGVRYGGFADPDKNYFPTRKEDIQRGSGAWVPIRQILNYPYLLPHTGRMNPTEWRDASLLPWGTTDPQEPAFDDRNLIDGAGDVLEIALPWGMLSMADPSTKRLYAVHAVPQTRKQVSTLPVERLGISFAVQGEPLMKTAGYSWEPWDTVQWHERRKAGWPILRREFQAHLPAAFATAHGFEPAPASVP